MAFVIKIYQQAPSNTLYFKEIGNKGEVWGKQTKKEGREFPTKGEAEKVKLELEQANPGMILGIQPVA